MYVALIGILSNFVALFIPRSKLKEDKFPFKSFKWEKNGRIYDKLKIRFWKNKVPDMSKILKFIPAKEVKSSFGSREIKALIKETCIAELVHVALAILSSAVLFICPSAGGIVIFIGCIIVNLPFILIQRYNRPQYSVLCSRLQKRESLKESVNK